MASNGTGWDEFGVWMALSTGQRCVHAPPKGCTGLSAGANGGAGASERAIASTSLASASSIHRNGIGFRIGLLPATVFGMCSNLFAGPFDTCELGHILTKIYITF